MRELRAKKYKYIVETKRKRKRKEGTEYGEQKE